MQPRRGLPARVALFFGWDRSPVWYRTGEDVGPVPLDSLPISTELRDRLEAWSAFADRTLSVHDFEWPDPDVEAEHVTAGSVLAQDVRDELGIEVIYGPDGDADEPLPVRTPRADHAGTGWSAHAPLADSMYRPGSDQPADEE